MTFKVIETFSGIGAQAKALTRIKNNNPTFEYDIVATVEWEIGAMFAYDIIHHGEQDLSSLENINKTDLISFLQQFNLSSDGKNPMKKNALSRMSEKQLKAIYHSIIANKNLVDISSVHASDLPYADLLTYSFPCQDLSISSYWHQNFSGIDKNANNRSSLLWQIERILKEYSNIGKEMPRFLLMENVTAIRNPHHVDNFNMWCTELRNLGYENYSFDLNAKNFGIPQNRVRTYMLSILVGEHEQEINHFFQHNTRLNRVTENPDIFPYLRLRNYSNDPVYYNEAMESTPNFTPSRREILRDSLILAEDNQANGEIAKTITTKQDRNPNAGLIIHNLNFNNVLKAPYRNLTPRETFLLMGFDEMDFQALMDNNFQVSKTRNFLSHSKLLKLSGNSIVVNVLEEIFSEMLYINNVYLENNNVRPYIERRTQ